MTKVIERPTSTTYVLDFPFHYIKDENEMKNVVATNQGKEIFQVMRSMDPNTFQPLLYFAFKEEGKPFSDWMKYVAKMEIYSETK
jgi:hypothetical protein